MADHVYFSCSRAFKCYQGTKVLTEVILHSLLNHPHATGTPLETLPRKPLQNPRKILQTTWRDMSLFHCLGVPAHINKRITQNLTNSGRHSISTRFFFSVLFHKMRNSICNFKAIIAALFHVRKETRHAVRLGSERVINMPAISFVWMLGKTNLLQGKKKKRHSVLVYCLPTCVWSAEPWLTVICPVHVHRPGVMRRVADSGADSFTGTL